MLLLTPDFETLHPPGASQTQCFEIRKLHVAEDFEMLRLTCDFKTLRLTPTRCQPDTTFQNIASDAHQMPARRSISKSDVRLYFL